MTEFSENPGLEDTHPIDAIDEEYALQEIGNNLEFLHDNSKNFDLYLAFKAYHEDRNFEEAVEKFDAAVAYEREHGAPAETGPSGEKKPNATLVKCLYWLAESHNKVEQRDKAIEIFEMLARDYDSHYLGLAARRRAEKLRSEA